MHKNISLLPLLIIITNFITISTFAQVGADSDDIWSLVRLDPTSAENLDPNYKWDEKT